MTKINVLHNDGSNTKTDAFNSEWHHELNYSTGDGFFLVSYKSKDGKVVQKYYYAPHLKNVEIIKEPTNSRG